MRSQPHPLNREEGMMPPAYNVLIVPVSNCVFICLFMCCTVIFPLKKTSVVWSKRLVNKKFFV